MTLLISCFTEAHCQAAATKQHRYQFPMVSHELTIILPLYILYAANFQQLPIVVWECRQPVDHSAIHVTHLDVCFLHGSLQLKQWISLQLRLNLSLNSEQNFMKLRFSDYIIKSLWSAARWSSARIFADVGSQGLPLQFLFLADSLRVKRRSLSANTHSFLYSDWHSLIIVNVS